jgi:hypothetical protein
LFLFVWLCLCLVWLIVVCCFMQHEIK